VGLARVVGLDAGLRIVVSLYVVAFLLAFHVLVGAAQGRQRAFSEPAWPAVLGAALVR
jgi:hypothetical protein